MLKKGTTAPTFAVPGATAENKRTYRSSEFTGDVVPFFNIFWICEVVL